MPPYEEEVGRPAQSVTGMPTSEALVPMQLCSVPENGLETRHGRIGLYPTFL